MYPYVEALQARYTGVKSHYGKAKVIVEDKNNSKLQSYSTIVAEIKNGKLFVYGEYSLTTKRHIKDYINQYSNEYVSNNDDIRALIEKTEQR